MIRNPPFHKTRSQERTLKSKLNPNRTEPWLRPTIVCLALYLRQSKVNANRIRPLKGLKGWSPSRRATPTATEPLSVSDPDHDPAKMIGAKMILVLVCNLLNP